MRIRSLRILWLAAAWTLAATPAALAAEDALPCRPRLVHCNYAEHFSGSIHSHAVLKADAAGERPASESTEDLTVTVVDGKATCSGAIGGKAIRGTGGLAVERGTSMDDAPDRAWYSITVACPGVDGTTPEIDNAQIKTYKQADTTGFGTLAGRLEQEHPDTDPVNGVSGTIRLEWSLSRKSGSAP